MTKITKWAIALAIISWGLVSILVLCGEDTPGNPMSITTFFISKGLAALSLYACYRIGKYAYCKGYLPEYFGATDDNDTEIS